MYESLKTRKEARPLLQQEYCFLTSRPVYCTLDKQKLEVRSWSSTGFALKPQAVFTVCICGGFTLARGWTPTQPLGLPPQQGKGRR